MILPDGEQLEQISYFKYLVYIWMNSELMRQCCRNVGGAIKSLVNITGLSLERDKFLNDSMLLYILI